MIITSGECSNSLEHLSSNLTIAGGDPDPCAEVHQVSKKSTLLIVGGLYRTQPTETFRLQPKPEVCSTTIEDFPEQHVDVEAGFIQSQNRSGIAACTHNTTSDDKDKCYFLPSGTSNWILLDQTLMERRWGSSSIVIDNGKTLWIIGGTEHDNYSKISKTTELVTILDEDSPSEYVSIQQGPDLPFGVMTKCMAKINSTTAIWTGSGYKDQNQTYYVDIPNVGPTGDRSPVKVVKGPELNIERWYHICGVLTDPGDGHHKVAIVAGGQSGLKYVKSTELLVLDSLDLADQGWIQGPDMPTKIRFTLGVTSPDGKSLLVIGGMNDYNNNLRSIYQLQYRNGCWQWSELDQKLQVPKAYHAAILVPDSFCSKMTIAQIEAIAQENRYYNGKNVLDLQDQRKAKYLDFSLNCPLGGGKCPACRKGSWCQKLDTCQSVQKMVSSRCSAAGNPGQVKHSHLDNVNSLN